MIFLDKNSGKRVEVSNEYLLHLMHTIRSFKFLFSNLNPVYGKDSSGCLYEVYFDLFDKVSELLYSISTDSLDRFTKSLYVSFVLNLNLRCVEEEEDVVDGEILPSRRLYPFRKFVKLLEYEKKKKKK